MKAKSLHFLHLMITVLERMECNEVIGKALETEGFVQEYQKRYQQFHGGSGYTSDEE